MKRLILDAEWTTDGTNRIWCVVTKDVSNGEIKVWTSPDGLNTYLADADTIIGANIIAADAPTLRRIWKTKIRLSQLRDTLVLSRLAKPIREGGHSVKAWGIRVGEPKIDFNDYNTDDPVINQQRIEYCIGDVNTTHKIWLAVEKEIADLGVSDEAIQLEHEVQDVIAGQEQAGFKLDVVAATTLLATLKGRMTQIEEDLQSVFPPIVTERYSAKTGKRLKDAVEVFNPGSRQQIGKRLTALGWKPKKLTATGQPVIDEGTLANVSIPQAKPIAEYLMIQKRVGQLEAWLDVVGEDGRVRGKVNTIGAATHRASHYSPNMAQVPATRIGPDDKPLMGTEGGFGVECRSCWIVEPGHVLVGVDAEGVQLRGLAHYMQDPEYIETVVNGKKENGTDIHTVNTKAFGFHLRGSGKTGIYAFLFGAAGVKMYTIAEEDARAANDTEFKVLKGDTLKRKYGDALIQRFLNKLPALKKLREKLVRMVSSKGRLPGLDGRRLLVDQERLALVTLLQAFEAVVMKKAMVLLRDRAAAAGIPYKQVAWVHDEFQLETPEQYGEVLGQMAADCIREAGEYFGSRCPLAGSYSVGKSWYETH